MGAPRSSLAKDSARPRRQSVAHVSSPWWGVLLLLILALAVGGLAVGGVYLWLATAPPEVRVPEVTGIDIRAAEQILARRGLVGQVSAHRYHEKASSGVVIAATPSAGRTVRQGRVVELTVSDGPPWVRMPDLREMELERARKVLAQSDLRLVRIKRRYDDAVPSGWVVEQTPAGDVQVARRAGVELIVSAGPRPRLESPETAAEPKYAVVDVVLREDDRDSLVRIEVEDQRGITVAYSAWHAPGSTVSRTVTGYGDAIARVYVDGKLIKEKRF